MALYLTGDTHGNFRRFLPESFYEQETMTKKDIVLVCGDLGGVWYGDKRDDDGLDFLERRPFTTAFVPGNHENYDALRTYPLEEWHGGTVRPIRPSVLMLERGQVFELGGKRIFAMGGASSHDIRDGILEPDDPLFQKKFQRLNAQGALFRDYIITHCAPTSIQNALLREHSAPDALTDFLEEVSQRCRFKYHFFGHYHSNQVIQQKYVLLYEQILRLK